MKRLVLIAAVAGLAAAIHYLPWWATAGAVIALPVLAWVFFRHVVRQFFLGAFKAKSAVLAGATARVHSIEPAEPYKPDDEDDDDLLDDLETPHHWVLIDLEVTTPETPSSPMSFWEPHDLALIAEHADPDDFESDETVGHIYGVEVMENGAWIAVDGKIAGSQRLRLHVAAKSGVDRFRIRYYFELLANAA